MSKRIAQLELEILHERAKEQVIDVCLNAVMEVTGYTKAQLAGRSRERDISDARHAFFHVVGIQTTAAFSLKETGKVLGRDHATVMHSRRVALDYLQTEAAFRSLVNRISLKIPSIAMPMTPKQKEEAIGTITKRISDLTTWLKEHPQNPYRIKVLADIRDLEAEEKKLNTLFPAQ